MSEDHGLINWKEMLALSDTVALCGLSAHALKQQAECGRAHARKMGGQWEADEYAAPEGCLWRK